MTEGTQQLRLPFSYDESWNAPAWPNVEGQFYSQLDRFGLLGPFRAGLGVATSLEAAGDTLRHFVIDTSPLAAVLLAGVMWDRRSAEIDWHLLADKIGWGAPLAARWGEEDRPEPPDVYVLIEGGSYFYPAVRLDLCPPALLGHQMDGYERAPGQWRVSQPAIPHRHDAEGHPCALFADFRYRWPQAFWGTQSETEAFLRAWQHSYLQAQAATR